MRQSNANALLYNFHVESAGVFASVILGDSFDVFTIENYLLNERSKNGADFFEVRSFYYGIEVLKDFFRFFFAQLLGVFFFQTLEFFFKSPLTDLTGYEIEFSFLGVVKNEDSFDAKLYVPEDAPWGYSCVGKFGNVAKRRVNTIIDKDIAPWSNMVLGEVLNDRGNWSGYLPHRHPQPECYYFKFDRPEGFGASFVGDEVFKSVDNSFSAIPGGRLHPQSAAPGYLMYTCWMIRHLDGNPWTDRIVDPRYTWIDARMK